MSPFGLCISLKTFNSCHLLFSYRNSMYYSNMSSKQWYCDLWTEGTFKLEFTEILLIALQDFTCFERALHYYYCITSDRYYRYNVLCALKFRFKLPLYSYKYFGYCIFYYLPLSIYLSFSVLVLLQHLNFPSGINKSFSYLIMFPFPILLIPLCYHTDRGCDTSIWELRWSLVQKQL